MAGYIHVILGPMFAGKSTKLINIVNRYKRSRKVLFVRPSIDSRGYLTHEKDELKLVDHIFVEKIEHLFDKVDNYDLFAIDEAHFFPDIVDVAILADKYHKQVFMSALSATSERKLFGNIFELTPHCDHIEFVNGICSECGNEKGSFTQFTQGIKEKDVVVGGVESYRCLCRGCWNNTSGTYSLATGKPPEVNSE